MNKIIKNTLRTGVIAAFGLAAFTACSDNWDEHYDSLSTTTTAYDGTTMQALEQNASDFAEIVKATGFDIYLNSPSSYTVWAPANGTFDKESIMKSLGTDKAGVAKQFVKNHIALYSKTLNLESQQITLLNGKLFTMTDKEEHKIGDVNISETQNNIKCNNGILHIIDGRLPFQYNLYEYIEAEYNKSGNATKADSSMYAFLSTANQDSLIENQSVYRGYDEFGEKIWVDSVTRRNNSILRDFNALIYEEDSDYIALIPSVEAYQARYSIAKSLMNFNPYMNSGLEYDRVDSLRNDYANRFAMTDLFYARSQNEGMRDSLKSTQFNGMNWPEHIYYRKQPQSHDMPLDKDVNDILAKIGEADSIPCSNGIAYVFDEYPISIYEQFFKKIDNNAFSLARNYINPDTQIKGSGEKVTKNVSGTESMQGTWTVTKAPYIIDEETGEPMIDEETGMPMYDWGLAESVTQSYSYFYVKNSGTQNPSIGFEIPNNFSGKYDIYIVTMPIWFYLNEVQEFEITNKRAYRFYTYIWEKNASGNYPTAGTRLTDNTGSYLFETPAPTDIYTITDTTFVGTYDFEYAYYGEDEPGVILQIVSNVTSSMRNDYSYNMLFSGIVLKPHDDDSAPATEIKAMQLKALPNDVWKSKSFVKTFKQ